MVSTAGGSAVPYETHRGGPECTQTIKYTPMMVAMILHAHLEGCQGRFWTLARILCYLVGLTDKINLQTLY